MKTKKTYYIVVGNVGTMEYTSKKLAYDCFVTYRTMSMQNITSAAGESVTLFEGENIINEHIGTVDIDA
jgi:hypothetical protein